MEGTKETDDGTGSVDPESSTDGSAPNGGWKELFNFTG